MKLLFDQNLSHRLVHALQKEFPDSRHVREVGLQAATDAVVWQYAAQRGFAIVAKDADVHHSMRTEQTYGHWVARFLNFRQGRHPAKMAEPDINRFLTHLVLYKRVGASTQDQALAALLFLYCYAIERDVGDLGEIIRARKPERLPVVMTPVEVKAVLAYLASEKRLMASLMYEAGLRLMECLRLRVQNIDFSRNEILVRDGKGAKDRMTMLPESLNAPLQAH